MRLHAAVLAVAVAISLFWFSSHMSSPIVDATFAFIKPDAVRAGHAEAILKRIVDEGFEIAAQKRLVLPRALAEEFYAEHKERSFFGELVDFMTGGEVVALVLMKEGAVPAWRALIGPTNSIKARAEAPGTIRALYGKDGSENAAHGSDSTASAAREIALVFPEVCRTFAFIKPDAFKAGFKEAILARIEKEGFSVVAAKELTLSGDQAGSFYAEHKGRPFYEGLVSFMTSGPALALVLERANAIKAWRQLMGPTMPGKARDTAPNTLRAEFGSKENDTFNATHGSDSVEAVRREVAIVFGEAEAAQLLK